MPLVISDEMLEQMHMTDREARIEVACRLYDAEKIPTGLATRLSGLSRVELWDELRKRGLPIMRLGDEYWEQEKKALESWGIK